MKNSVSKEISKLIDNKISHNLFGQNRNNLIIGDTMKKKNDSIEVGYYLAKR